MIVSLLTPVLPSAARFLADTAATVAQGRALADPAVRTQWVIAVDGPGDLNLDVEADRILRLPRQAGAAAARTAALVASVGDWVVPLDADDLLDPAGFADLIHQLAANALSDVGWLSTNRVLLDGARTPHWCDQPRRWERWQLEEEWTAPFPFHPNSIAVRRDLALRVGGWPAFPVNEDLGFVMAASELAPGLSRCIVVTRYRRWEHQQVAAEDYPTAKRRAFAAIAATVNARRRAAGLAPITAPEPGGPHGITPSHAHH